MKQSLWMAALLVAAAALGSWSPAAQEGAKDVTRIGTFDSRALAIAYANSDLFREATAGARKQHAEAKAQGDTETMERIEAEMVALQAELHGQTFSTAPIDGILAAYPGDLAAIAGAHGACVLVSKWDLAWQDRQAPLVDLTEALVAPYQPDERTLGWIRDLKNVDPLPLEEVRKIDH